MQIIRTFQDLNKELLACSTGQCYENILSRVAIPIGELEPFCRWNDRHYTRTCITRTRDFELMLICYEPGQRTSIHDYDTQQAWVYPVLGTVKEERFMLDQQGHVQPITTNTLQRSSFLRSGSERNIHRHINPGPGRAVTLNLYAKPLMKWNVYDERSGGAGARVTGE